MSFASDMAWVIGGAFAILGAVGLLVYWLNRWLRIKENMAWMDQIAYERKKGGDHEGHK